MLMLFTEDSMAFILKNDAVISKPNILFDIIIGFSLTVNGNYINVIKAPVKRCHFTFPSIVLNSHFKDES